MPLCTGLPHLAYRTLPRPTLLQWPVLSRIATEEGAASLWRGWQPRVLFHAPAAAICWGVYETCKRLLEDA